MSRSANLTLFLQLHVITMVVLARLGWFWELKLEYILQQWERRSHWYKNVYGNAVPTQISMGTAFPRVPAPLHPCNLPPGGWLTVTCRLTAVYTRGSAQGPTLSIEYVKPLPAFVYPNNDMSDMQYSAPGPTLSIECGKPLPAFVYPRNDMSDMQYSFSSSNNWQRFYWETFLRLCDWCWWCWEMSAEMVVCVLYVFTFYWIFIDNCINFLNRHSSTQWCAVSWHRRRRWVMLLS